MENIDWKNLPFGYFKTDYNIRCYYRHGRWGELEVSSSEILNLHISATCVHYGQEAFEGMKAYCGKDGKVRLFRCEENALRMQSSARVLQMAEVPTELFKEAVIKTVKLNRKYVPPYGTGATLYIRPLLIGTEPKIGVNPANEYLFMIFVCPVGPYFKTGFNPVKILLERDTDRAAPLGTGNIKAGGNYGASLRAIVKAHQLGYSSILYLDSKEKKYIDECGPANFFGIKNNTYVTPASITILPSITNKSLIVLAKDIGLKVEQRKVALEELDTFEEVGACGTAAIITPIKQIDDLENNKTYTYCKDGKAGPVSTKLYNMLTGIQFGDIADKFGWVEIVE